MFPGVCQNFYFSRTGGDCTPLKKKKKTDGPKNNSAEGDIY